MTWLSGIIILFVGIIIGLIANRFLPIFNNAQQNLSEELEQSQQAQESLKRELTDYLASVEGSFQQLATQAEQAAQKANEYNKRITESDKPAEEIIPYFGNQVSHKLKETKPVEQLSKQYENKTNQDAPLDYTEGNSGILVGEESK